MWIRGVLKPSPDTIKPFKKVYRANIATRVSAGIAYGMIKDDGCFVWPRPRVAAQRKPRVGRRVLEIKI